MNDINISTGLPEGIEWDKKKLSRVIDYIAKESKKQSPERILRNKKLSTEYLTNFIP